MIKVEDYQIHKSAQDKLNKFELHNNVYKHRQWVYRNLVQLEVYIDFENYEWCYQVLDNHGGLYNAYYDNEYGRNEVADKVSENVEKIINKMVKNKILIKGEINEKSSRI